MVDNALDPFFNFLCSYRPENDGFIIDGIYYRWIKDYVGVARKINRYDYTDIFKNKDCTDDIFTPQDGILRHLYAAYLINHGYEYDELREALETFEENQDILEYMFNWLRQNYKPAEAFFNFSKYLGALRDWGYKLAPMSSSEQETSRILDEFYPLTMTINTDGVNKDELAKILGEQHLSFVDDFEEKPLKAFEPIRSFKGVKEVESECTICLKVHKAIKEKPTSNGAYWCACSDVMDGNVLDKCFWCEVTFFNGMWCVDDGTLVLAWMTLPPSQNPKDFF